MRSLVLLSADPFKTLSASRCPLSSLAAAVSSLWVSVWNYCFHWFTYEYVHMSLAPWCGLVNNNTSADDSCETTHTWCVLIGCIFFRKAGIHVTFIYFMHTLRFSLHFGSTRCILRRRWQIGHSVDSVQSQYSTPPLSPKFAYVCQKCLNFSIFKTSKMCSKVIR